MIFYPENSISITVLVAIGFDVMKVQFKDSCKYPILRNGETDTILILPLMGTIALGLLLNDFNPDL
jgi:hypothetical protein